MVVLIGASMMFLMFGCASIEKSIMPQDTPICKTQDVYIGFYDKAFIHVAGKDGGMITLEAQGPGYFQPAEKEKDLDRITVEPIEDNDGSIGK
jgi:hypothetical protein